MYRQTSSQRPVAVTSAGRPDAPRPAGTVGNTESLVRIAVALAVAVVLASAVRGITVEVNRSLGHVWPFALGYCHTKATPGCDTDGADRVIAEGTR